MHHSSEEWWRNELIFQKACLDLNRDIHNPIQHLEELLGESNPKRGQRQHSAQHHPVVLVGDRHAGRRKSVRRSQEQKVEETQQIHPVDQSTV